MGKIAAWCQLRDTVFLPSSLIRLIRLDDFLSPQNFNVCATERVNPTSIFTGQSSVASPRTQIGVRRAFVTNDHKVRKVQKCEKEFEEAHGVEPWTYRTAADCSTTELYLQLLSPSPNSRYRTRRLHAGKCSLLPSVRAFHQPRI